MASDWTYDELLAGREKAKAAGDDEAVQLFNEDLETRPQYVQQWRNNAEAAGDMEVANKITEDYYQSKEYKDEDLVADPVWQEDSQRLYKTVKGQEFEGDPLEAGKWGLDFRRRIDSGTLTQIDQIRRNLSGDIGEKERKLMERIDAGYAPLGMSLSGTGAHLWNILNPVESPDTIAGLGVGGLVTKGGLKGATKVAPSAIKAVQRRAGGGLSKEVAEEAAQDAVGAGARTVGQRVRSGAAVGGLEGAGYGALGDAAQQTYQEPGGEYNVDRGLGAAATGAAMGAGIGGAAGTVVGRSGKTFQRAADEARGATEVNPAGSQRIMRTILEKSDTEAPEVLEKWDSGDIAGAYRALPEDAKDLSGDQIYDVLQTVDAKLTPEINTIKKDTTNIISEYGLGEKLKQEISTALSTAKKRGVSVTSVFEDPKKVPNFAELPSEVKDRLIANVQRLDELANQVSDIRDFSADIIGKKSAVEEILEKPEVNVALDALPSGYILSRSGARVAQVLRKRALPKKFRRGTDAAASIDPEASIGPNMAARARIAQDSRRGDIEAASVLDEADRSIANKASLRAIQEGRQVLRNAKGVQHKLSGADRFGGVQGEWALTYSAAPKRMGEALDRGLEMLDEGEVPAGVMGDVDRLAKLGNRWKQFYDANVTTKPGYVTGTPQAEKELYYDLEKVMQMGLQDLQGGDLSSRIKDLTEKMQFLNRAIKEGSGASDEYKTRAKGILYGAE
jgi:hypothetical protein